MSARRCTLCGINYPVRFQVCPVHGESTDYFMDLDPHENWEWRATALLAGITAAQASELDVIPVVPVTTTPDSEGRHWISSQALIRLGLTKRLQPYDVIEIPRHEEPLTKNHPCDCLWKVIMYRDSTRSYWIQPLRVPDFAPH